LLALLSEKGLVIESAHHAAHALNNVSYYRLSAYFKSYQLQNLPGNPFVPGTSFSDIWMLYSFDKKLRSIVMDAIERYIEFASLSPQNNGVLVGVTSIY